MARILVGHTARRAGLDLCDLLLVPLLPSFLSGQPIRPVHPLLFHFGHIAIPTYGACTALALLLALAVSVWTARRAGLDADKVWNLELIAILTALFAARLLMIAGHPHLFRDHPFWLLGLMTMPNLWITLGGVLVGVLGALLYAFAEGLPVLRVADALAPAVALAFAVQRVGAFCGGSAWGTPTQLPWGVVYRSPVAYLWYRVPLGVRLHPVQLYDAAASVGIFVVLLWMGRAGGSGRGRTEQAGEIAGAWLFLYGVIRFFLEFFRGDPARQPLLDGSVTVAQVLAVGAVVVGGGLWLRRDSAAEPAAEQFS
jgi:phosphatidylglycerol:prolipoprotein diacylglycerol transferase